MHGCVGTSDGIGSGIGGLAGAVRGLTSAAVFHEDIDIEMASPEALQCLFCQHVNPAGATFCNTCGSQLQLQQCDRCGSINKRSASNCYKCGAPCSASPALAGDGSVGVPAPRCGGESEATTLPEALALAMRTQGRRSGLALPAARETEPGGAATVGSEACRFDEAGDPPLIESAFLSEVAAATGFQRLRRVALTVLVMAAVAMLLYAYRPAPVGSAGTVASSGEPVADVAAPKQNAPASASPCPDAVAALGLCAVAVAQEASAHD